MRKILFIALTGMIWSACSTSAIPDPGLENPVFSVFIEGDSSTNQMVAGQAGIYLFTRVERGNDGVIVMSGSFANADCPSGDCPGSLRFEFRNVHQDNFVEPTVLFQDGSSWMFKSPASPDSLALHTVAVQWVKSDGSILRSDGLQQPPDSLQIYFNIHASEPWELNELGEKTWKMDLDFSCWLFDSVLHQESKVSGGGTIAVGYQ